MDEFSLEAYRKSKEYKENLKRFQNRLYFDKKFRKKILKTVEDTRSTLLKILEKPGQPKTFEEVRWRALSDSLLDKLAGFQDLESNVERFFKEDAVSDGKFRLFRKGKEAVFVDTYRKGGKRKLRRAYFYLREGFPKKARKRGVLVKERDFPLKGFIQADEGIFTQTRKSFEKTILRFTGKNKYKFIIYMRGKNPENLWVEMTK